MNSNIYRKLKEYIGIISFKGSTGKRQKGSACIFSYNGKWLLATAAHCVFDIETNEYNKEFYFFIPGRKSKINLGNRVYLHQLWPTLYAPEYDIAFFKLEENEYIRSLDLEFIKPKFSVKTNNYFDIAGFPGKIPFWESLYIEHDKFGECDYIYGSSLIGIRTSKGEGMSGGPLLIKKIQRFYIGGTVSLKFNSQKNMLWSAPWNRDIEYLLTFLTGITQTKREFILDYYWE